MSEWASQPREVLEATLDKWRAEGLRILAENNELQQQLTAIQPLLPLLPNLQWLHETFIWSGDTTSDEFGTASNLMPQTSYS